MRYRLAWKSNRTDEINYSGWNESYDFINDWKNQEDRIWPDVEHWIESEEDEKEEAKHVQD